MIGRTQWALAEGYIPSWSHGPSPELTSHETICLLNTNDETAHVRVTIYFEDRAPVGPYRIEVPPKRTRHIRFNELDDPATIPYGLGFSSVIESDVPIVVQHTRLDSRAAENALMTTMAYPGDH